MTARSSGIGHPAFGGTVGAVTYNPLIMPGKPEVRSAFTIKGGQTLVAGSVLGAITAAGPDFGKLVLSTAAAVNGSQIPFAILAEDLDTTSGDKEYSVYVEGMFNEAALVFGAGHDANTVRVPLRNAGIYLTAPRHSYV